MILLFSPFIVSNHQPYVNIFSVIYSSSTNYSYNNTLLPTLSSFEYPSSEQIASDIIYCIVHASPHTSLNNLQLVVLENMLINHYRLSLISHIDLLLLVFLNCNYTTFETIIRS